MGKYIERILVSRDEIQKLCKRLGQQITADYQGKEIIAICVLKGAFVFLADLIRCIDVPCTVDFMSVTSYQGTQTTGVVRSIRIWTTALPKHILIVEISSTRTYVVVLVGTVEDAIRRVFVFAPLSTNRIGKTDIHVDYIRDADPRRVYRRIWTRLQRVVPEFARYCRPRR